jgi:SAM-dependent methyltransferase
VTLWQAWDEHSGQWIEWARGGDDAFGEQTWPQLAALLPHDPGLVVEVGCGEGRAARELQRLGHPVVGVERSWRLAQAACQHPEPVLVLQGDAARLPLPDGCAGTAVACMSLLDIDDLAASVNEIGRVLRPGGHACVALVHPFISAFDAGAYRAGQLVVSGPYLAERRYVDHAESNGVKMTFVSMHRPLRSYMASFFAAGFVMDGFREVGSSDLPWLVAARFVRCGDVAS